MLVIDAKLIYFSVRSYSLEHAFRAIHGGLIPLGCEHRDRWKSQFRNMRSSKLLSQRLSSAPTLNAARHHTPPAYNKSPLQPLQSRQSPPTATIQVKFSHHAHLLHPQLSNFSRLFPKSPASTVIHGARAFKTSSARLRELKPSQGEQNQLARREDKAPVQLAKQAAEKVEEEELDHEQEERGFERSEKANQASQVNLSARLSSPKDQGSGAGLKETWRLIKIARPEAGVLGWAFLFLIISSSISMTIPWSIGKFLDVATKSGENGENQLYGFDLSTLYMALGGILVVGASANYGRIIILRIVGERIVARLRSQLFRRTFAQNAEFFDANRVGDLISRLSSDTVIVGKSITQNLSDGLRSFVSGVAGLSLMAYVSLKLTSVLAICFPPVAVGTVLYGRAIRNLSRKIQKNLGTLTKIAEERLGNVRTSQAFAGEILEVSRYNKQVKKIFSLGKREAFISATYFSTVGRISSQVLFVILMKSRRALWET